MYIVLLILLIVYFKTKKIYMGLGCTSLLLVFQNKQNSVFPNNLL